MEIFSVTRSQQLEHPSYPITLPSRSQLLSGLGPVQSADKCTPFVTPLTTLHQEPLPHYRELPALQNLAVRWTSSVIFPPRLTMQINVPTIYQLFHMETMSDSEQCACQCATGYGRNGIAADSANGDALLAGFVVQHIDGETSKFDCGCIKGASMDGRFHNSEASADLLGNMCARGNKGRCIVQTTYYTFTNTPTLPSRVTPA